MKLSPTLVKDLNELAEFFNLYASQIKITLDQGETDQAETIRDWLEETEKQARRSKQQVQKYLTSRKAAA